MARPGCPAQLPAPGNTNKWTCLPKQNNADPPPQHRGLRATALGWGNCELPTGCSPLRTNLRDGDCTGARFVQYGKYGRA